MFDFTGKVAVVTGGSGVLCGALCRALASHGASVVVVANSQLGKAQGVVDAIEAEHGIARAAQADVLSKASLLQLADDVLEAYGRVDFLINGAGGTRKEATTSDTTSFFDLPEEAVRTVCDLNFMGTFLPCQVFARIMNEQGGGAILNLSSMGAIQPLTRSVAYSAGKAAVANFTQWLAVHLAQEYTSPIRVNALVPGFFLTEQNKFLLTDEATGALTERGQRIVAQTPMGRFGDCDDLVGPALFLLDESARFVHGAALVVDGGLNAYGGV
ncbi:MAG: SDR family oxidoreductase [Lentisphaerae bacterium]|nr:SDR family oxidoreductase [Lentisphaerota bacterium]